MQMKPFDIAELLALAALWGASFLFMRMGAGEFGPVALAAVRVGGACVVLLPLLAWRGHAGELRRHWRPLFVIGLLNSALPFLFYAYAATSITAGLASIFNASTPLFGAVIAWAWLGDRPNGSRALGLVVGFAGVLWLAADKASFRPGGTGLAVLACLGATLCYGLSASYTKRYLSGVPPLAVAAGTQAYAAPLLLPPGAWLHPATMPSAQAWIAALLLAVASTGVAYLLYFRLIARTGPANAMTVTFLIPLFAVVWGWLFLGEGITPAMVAGGIVILLGTALSTGLLRLPALRPKPG